MHLFLIGTFKTIVNNLFNVKNRYEPFYLGKNLLLILNLETKLRTIIPIGRHLNEIDKILLKVPLPLETARNTRSLSEHFKANEWRIFLPEPYLGNIVKYVLFLRV